MRGLGAAARWGVAVAAVVGLVAAAGGCDDDDATPTSATGSAETSSGDSESGSVATDVVVADGAVGDEGLLVGRDYLQGEWCDSEGQHWTIDGDTARAEDPAGGGAAEFPVEIRFADGPDIDLVSQSDDQFVLGAPGSDATITFRRGAC